MRSKLRLRSFLVFLVVSLIISFTGIASAELAMTASVQFSQGTYYVTADVSDTHARVKMDLLQGEDRIQRIRANKTGEASFEGTLSSSLDAGEYEVRVTASLKDKEKGLQSVSESLSLVLNEDYVPVSSPLKVQAKTVASVARELPFMGTNQPQIIEAGDTVSVNGVDIELDGELVTAEKADLNGDGAMDIIAGGGTLFAYDVKNSSYLWAIDESSENKVEEIDDIAIADITGDGTPDVVTIDYYNDYNYENEDTILKGLCLWDGSNGDLLWTVDMTSYNRYETYHSECLAIADLDADGDLDIAAAGYIGVVSDDYSIDAIAAFDGKTGDLLWEFDTPSDDYLDTVYEPSCLEVGDIDGDGKPEVAAGDDNGQVYCLNGEDGSEVFVVEVPDEEYVEDIELADFDQDGDLDIAAGSYYYVTAYNEDGGQLWQYDEMMDGSEYWEDLEIADFNGDGVPDVAAVNYLYYSWAVIDGSSGFSIASGGTYDYGLSVAVGDLNGDGVPELILGDKEYATGAVDVTTGNWLWCHDNDYDYVYDLEVADFDGDGELEVLGVPEDDFLYLLPGRADSNVWGRGFEAVGPYWENYYSELQDVAAADLNGDGFDDVIVVDEENCQVTAMDGTDGTPLWSRFCADEPEILATGDFDGDGTMEVAAFGDGTVYLIDSDGSLLASAENGSALIPGAVDGLSPSASYISTADTFLVADLDGDGSDELVLGDSYNSLMAYGYSAGSLNVFFVTDDFNFHYSGDNDIYEEGLAFGDIDADGEEDLLALGYQILTPNYYTVNEVEISGDVTEVISGDGWKTIAVGQIDDDLQLEIMVGTDNGVEVYDALSGDEWTTAIDDGADHCLIIGDVDGDGYDEIAYAGDSNVGILEEDGTLLWSRDLSGTAENYYNDATEDIEDMILADLDGDGDLDLAVAGYERLNLRMLDGKTGQDLIDPVIIDGYGEETTQLAAGNFGDGAGTEIAAIGFQSAGVFAVNAPTLDPSIPPVTPTVRISSGGNCNVGALPAAFGLLMVPLLFLLRR